jgi:predicted transcriptional regulator
MMMRVSIALFRDNAQYDELMFSIIHGLEVFDDQTYVREILRGAASLCSKSPRWASILFMRMLNSEPTRLELVRQLRDAQPEVKSVIKSLMEKINDRSVQFLPKTAVVLAAAS